MPDNTVAIARCHAYEREAVSAAVREALVPLGGMAAFVSAGQRVLLKPNLLMKANPDRAVTTHPEVLRAVIREVAACAPAEILVGDSPGGRNSPIGMARLWDECGLTAVCAEEGCRLVLLDDEVVNVPNPNSQLYSSFDLGAAAIRADVLINLPKLKTHGFMMFTGAVKNCFGLIPGLAKAAFHVKVPDRNDFAEMLVDLALAAAPELTIMDAIIGMEGEGPAGGTPVPIGAVLASADGFALDLVATAVAGFEAADVYTIRAAQRRGLTPASADDVAVAGTPWREVRPSAFAKPTRDPFAAMPKWLTRSLRGVMVPRPELGQPEACTGCATCRENCPVDAITMKDRRPDFDYDACIRCYCCQELCPPQVIALREPWLLRLLTKRERGEA